MSGLHLLSRVGNPPRFLSPRRIKTVGKRSLARADPRSRRENRRRQREFSTRKEGRRKQSLWDKQTWGTCPELAGHDARSLVLVNTIRSTTTERKGVNERRGRAAAGKDRLDQDYHRLGGALKSEKKRPWQKTGTAAGESRCRRREKRTRLAMVMNTQ